MMNKGRWITLFSGSLVQAMQCFVFLDHRPLLARETVLFWGCKAEKSRVLFYCCFVPFLKAHMDQSDGLYISWLVQAKQPRENPRNHGENQLFVLVTTASSWC